MNTNSRDIFAEINAVPIAALWGMLGLPGEPKPQGNMRSPFHEDRKPSFSIYGDGFKWKDHSGTDQETGGDGVAFVMAALKCDAAEARRWWQVRHGIDVLDGWKTAPSIQKTARTPAPSMHPVTLPGEALEGTAGTWEAVGKRRGLSTAGVEFAVRAGILRFLRLEDGTPCFCITDNTRRAAEIRRLDGQLFGERKAYPLKMPPGAKSWLPGLTHAKGAGAGVGIFITEGATDLLTALAMYHGYRTQGGRNSWIPCAMLGAGCKTLSPEAQAIIRGRIVRIIPDGDAAGDAMAAHWVPTLNKLGCTVIVVKLPRDRDLSDMKDEIQVEELFHVRD